MEVDYLRKVDYLKLSEQYGSFLVAIGGVSITVLTLVLTFEFTPVPGDSRSYLVAALIVATISCFTGAHMMTETAAFISHARRLAEEKLLNELLAGNVQYEASTGNTGERLFVLASTNIFISVILVIFAAMLLPIVSRRVDVPTIAPISLIVFLLIIGTIIFWMYLAARHRSPAPDPQTEVKRDVITIVPILGAIVAIILFVWHPSRTHLLWVSFIPIAFSPMASLIHFAQTFEDGQTRSEDRWLFGSLVTLCCTLLKQHCRGRACPCPLLFDRRAGTSPAPTMLLMLVNSSAKRSRARKRKVN
jgi:hypothetical protein